MLTRHPFLMTDRVAPALTIVGSLNLDLIAKVTRRPESGETVGDGILTRQPGGKGANQAAAAARLGARVSMIGAVGDDAAGAELVSALSATGTDVSAIQVVATPTGTALITVDAHGENVIVVCPGANALIDPDAIDLPPGAVLAQLEVSDAVLERIAAHRPSFFALNLSPARPLPMSVYAAVDLFIVNELEYEQVPELVDAPLVALTLGARGARLLQRGEEIAAAAAPPAVVRSTVGAGDAFAAAITMALVRGDDLQDALARACAVGAAAVESDASQPEFDLLDAYPAE